MKQEILNWFNFSRDYQQGILLYYRFGNNRTIHKRFNSAPKSKDNYELLVEELRRLSELSLIELNTILRKPIKIRNEQPKAADKTKGPGLIIKMPMLEIPQKKIRDEFPFLNDPLCPIELKAMVSDKITAYSLYKQGHDELYKATSEEEQIASVKKTVENYLLNKAYYKELDYYAKNHKILGDSNFFDKMSKLQSLAAKTSVNLFVRLDNLEKYNIRDSKIIEGKKDHLRKKAIDRIESNNWEINVIKQLLRERNELV